MIKCEIDFNLKNASIYMDDCFLETKSFEDLSFKKETSIDFKNCNDLYLINKISIYLKLKYNAKDVDTIFIIDNKDIYDLLKPNGMLINKLSKSAKKSITNNELKLILGSTLFEINSMKNVDLILQEVKNMKGDDDMINNKINNNFNTEKKDSAFDVDSDFSFDLDSTIDEFNIDDDINLDNNIDLLSLDLINNDENLNLDKIAPDYSTNIYESNEDVPHEKSYIEENDIKYEKEIKDNFNLEKKYSLDNDIKNSQNNNLKDTPIQNIKFKKQDDLKDELLKEFKNMEKYIDEQIAFLEKQSNELEDENSKLKFNINDLNIDEETLINNFNKIMEIRLRLKVIKKSCKIYNNMKSQLIDELSKF